MFLVCGEALMDVFDAGATTTGTRLDARVGGSPFNVAVGLARLGQPVAFFGALGNGFLGERLLHALRDEGVDTSCVQRVRAPTTLGVVGLDTNGAADYAFYGEGAADRQLDPAALAQLPRARALHFGSYTMVEPPASETLRALVQLEHSRALIAYDPNVRLGVQHVPARWLDALDWMLPRTDVLKLSQDDFDALFPGADADAMAARWIARGVALVVLTRGAGGACAWTRSVRVQTAPPRVELVDTVGAGDSFQAALLARLAELELLDAAALHALDARGAQALLDFAAHAAAITCSRRGADPPRRTEIPR
ncbi:MAG: carbohydrate kinase [Burkholderiaceae bacterium]|nr:carbohydrate kinase [Burkholderiaceae bacterium]